MRSHIDDELEGGVMILTVSDVITVVITALVVAVALWWAI